MAKRKKKSLVNWTFVIVASLLLSVAVIITLSEHIHFPVFVPSWEQIGDKLDDVKDEITSNYNIPTVKSDKELKVHYIDVGQGDCMLLQCDGKNALIDSGERYAADKVINYLKDNSVSKLDLLIVTHPDSDHMGAMSDIIERFDIGTIYMSPIPDELVPTTKTYTEMLLAISAKGLRIKLAQAGDTINFGDIELFCVAPEGEFTSINDCSLAFKLVHGENSFLFAGDMEKFSEKATLQKKYDVSADVLKVAHHGSKSSTTDNFLEAVSPKAAIISVGEDNRYRHPDDKVIKALEKIGATVYRTDIRGDIVIVSDGEELLIHTEK